MISAIYTSLTALLIVYLSLKVVKVRRKHSVAYEDGGVEPLMLIRAAQSCVIEYMPILLLLLITLELSAKELSPYVIHGFGIVMLGSRAMHAYSLLSQNLKLRKISMHVTVYSLVGLAALNIIYAVI